jgi:Cellulase (glycosyl hydrolase family 5)
MRSPFVTLSRPALALVSLLTWSGCGGGSGGDPLIVTGTGGQGTGGAAGAGQGGSSGPTGSAGAGGATATDGGAGMGAGGAPDGGAGGAGTGGAGGTSVGGVTPPLTGLHVDKNQIKNDQGQVVRLHGVNRSGTEYRCVQSATAIFDGPSTDASIQVMTTWNVNAVRVPLNEDCWLAINGVAAATSGASYKTAITGYVRLLEARNIAPILELHWSAPGTTLANRQQPMPDADHAAAFWTDVATTFKADNRVIFEPFNEPYPDGNRDTTAAWTCWRDGCTANQVVATGQPAATYQAAGLQALVNAIRMAGATNLILLGGVQFSNTLSQWMTYKPTDSTNNIAAAWHIYNFNGCAQATCWNNNPAKVAAMFPIVATEFGENDCMGGTFVTSLMQWLDQQNQSYLAWTWDAYGACVAGSATGQGGSPWSLVGSYTSGTPNDGFAQAVHDHFLGL